MVVLAKSLPWDNESRRHTQDCRHIVLGASKGGVGKSTLAWQLALGIMNQGHPVVLADGDRQRNLAKNAERRKNQHPEFVTPPCVTFHGDKDISEKAKLIAGKGAKYVIYDIGGFMSNEMVSVFGFADLILSPLQPSQFDLDALQDIHEVITYVNKNQRVENGLDPISAKIILNRVETNTNSLSTRAALKTLQSIKVPEFSIVDINIKQTAGINHATSASMAVGEYFNEEHYASAIIDRYVRYILRGDV